MESDSLGSNLGSTFKGLEDLGQGTQTLCASISFSIEESYNSIHLMRWSSYHLFTIIHFLLFSIFPFRHPHPTDWGLAM